MLPKRVPAALVLVAILVSIGALFSEIEAKIAFWLWPSGLFIIFVNMFSVWQSKNKQRSIGSYFYYIGIFLAGFLIIFLGYVYSIDW